MKVIQYIRLYEYLREKEGLEGIQIIRNIYRLRKLPKTFLIEVEKLLNGQNPQLEVEGVSYQELTEKDGMLPIRAILMLDWIRRDSYAAFKYMEKKGLRAPIKPLTTEEENVVDEAIARLKKLVKEEPKEVVVDDSKEDIVIEDGNVEEEDNSTSEESTSIENSELLNEQQGDNTAEKVDEISDKNGDNFNSNSNTELNVENTIEAVDDTKTE